MAARPWRTPRVVNTLRPRLRRRAGNFPAARNFPLGPALKSHGGLPCRNEEASPVPGLKQHGSAAPQAEIVDLIPALRAFARTFYRETTEADDLVQETLTRALASLHQFRPGTSMKSWLFTIMRNAFYTRIKVETREAPGA
ncbi:MAG: hypothetical protein IH590_09270, partial [Aquamicrobium sp.]|nr:hypothetical protein [Aquamicrobium sp.]